MIVGVPMESAPGERRVALVPESAKALVAAGHELWIQRGAGSAAGFLDEAYAKAGFRLVSADELVGGAELIARVAPPSTSEIASLRSGSALVSLLRPLDEPATTAALARAGVSAFALELLPRITRAQSMDVLSSQSTIAGYRAVLLAAAALPRVFPMLVTAAGTLQPARCLIVGAGVAGLQALGTAKRLGAVTSAYDTRSAAREQVRSVGARFIELELDTADAEDRGGYAKAQDEAFYRRQREQLGKHVAASDVVVTTALVPGQPAPLLIEEAAVHAMAPGSVIVDLAAEKGGNCACTDAGRDTVVSGVTVIGQTNLAAQVPAHASQMFGRNVVTFLTHLAPNARLELDREDEITAGTLVSHDGEVVHEAVQRRLAGEG